MNLVPQLMTQLLVLKALVLWLREFASESLSVLLDLLDLASLSTGPSHLWRASAVPLLAIAHPLVVFVLMSMKFDLLTLPNHQLFQLSVFEVMLLMIVFLLLVFA